MLFRKTLIEKISDAEGYPFIQISGPAGSGKTSLACQWLAQANLTMAWYSLDDEDNEPDLFFRYLLSSLAQSDDHLNKAFGPVLGKQMELTEEKIIPLIIDSLSNVSREIHLILDDFHRITNDKIHHALARLITYIPPRLHLVILSRHGMPHSIDAILLKKEKMVLTAADLKFTEEEAATLYRTVLPLSIPSDRVHDLNRHLEGWAAGLQLIGLSLKSQGHLDNVSDILEQARDQVASYLIHDILRMQTERIRHFVFTTALLDRFNSDLCSEVSGMADAVIILDHLEHMNLFLIPLDTEHKWYRYHHLFSEVIRRQVSLVDSVSVQTVLRNSALWLAKRHHLEDALRTAFRTDDTEFAADLMEDYIMGYVETFDVAAGLRWISRLPEELLNRRPLLRLLQCGFHSFLMGLSDIRDIMAVLEKDGDPDLSRYSGDTQNFCQDMMACFRSMLRIFHEGEAAGVDQLQVLRNKIRPKNPLYAGYIDTHIVSIQISKGDLTLAESFLDRIARTVVIRPDQLMKKKVYHAHARALIARNRGQLHYAGEIIRQVLKYFNAQGYDDIPMAFLLHRHLGNIHYLRNDLETSRKFAVDALKNNSEYFGLFDELMAGNELWFQLHLAAGEDVQAVEDISKIRAQAIKLGMPRIEACADACAARMAIGRGNLMAAGEWSERRHIRPDEPFSLLYAMECLTQARLYSARGHYADALNLLETLLNRCKKRGLLELVLQINILQSAVLHATNRIETAATLLLKALAFSEIEGYVRPFASDAKLIAPVLKHIAANKPRDLAHDHIATILKACEIPMAGPMVPEEFIVDDHEKLTRREVEILGWIAQGFQNKEIAEKAYIAITTVKSHVSNILVKLNVKTRTQAVLKARAMKFSEHGGFAPSDESFLRPPPQPTK